jgi:Sec-independent protein translocase protein TatA
LNPLEIILILAVALIVIGPERMPEVMRAVGKVLRELRLASNTVLHELTEGLDEQPPKVRPPAPTNGLSGSPAGPPAPPSEKP